MAMHSTIRSMVRNAPGRPYTVTLMDRQFNIITTVTIHAEDDAAAHNLGLLTAFNFKAAEYRVTDPYAED